MKKSETAIVVKNAREIKPFLRWAGGKNWLLKHINKYLPNDFNNYFEPFLGGSALFTYLINCNRLNNGIYISDINKDLINTYSQIRDNVEEVIEHLEIYKNNKTFYYKIRAKSTNDLIETAAHFIFLNRTSFNGIYRENLSGEYNVPYGYKKYKTLFDFENLRKFSKKLKGATLRCCDFEEYLDKIKENDFVFLDPPYTVAHSNNGFIKYNQKLFSINDQQRLAGFIKNISDKGANFILTNASHKNIRSIFNEFHYKKIERFSMIGGKEAERKRVEELIFYNTLVKKQ